MKHIVKILIAFTLLSSCKESEITVEYTGSVGEVTLSLSFVSGGYSSTRTVSEEMIEDLNIYTIASDGRVITHRYIDSYNGESTNVIATTGGCRIAVVANLGSVVDDRDTLDELLEMAYSSSGVVERNIMSYLSDSYDFDYSQSTITLPTIYLERIYSKVTVTFNFDNLNSGVTITPQKIALKQVPTSTYFFTESTPTSTNDIALDGDFTLDELTPTSHTSATPLYLFENLQGAGVATSDESAKSPISGSEGICSYLEITATHSDSGEEREVIYRYWLGKDNTENFDIERNYWYKISISFNGNGGIDEQSWRVDVEELEQVMYIPFCEYRTTKYKINSAVRSVQFDFSRNYLFDYDKNYIYITTLADNVNRSKDLGAVTLSDNTVITMVWFGGNSNSFLPDVTQLLFPSNHSFGRTDYSITQHINFIRDDSSIGQWVARPTEEWIYIGDGEDFAAFKSVGRVGVQGVSGMVNCDTDKLESSSLCSDYLSVRCSENNSTEGRSGYVVFWDLSGEEIGRVVVEQGGNIGIKSPVMVEPFGGVFKMGNFTSDGSAGAANDYACSEEIYVCLSPYYLAVTECTFGQYCDFLNDIGLQNINELGMTYSTILDKQGGNSNIGIDFPGVIYNDFFTDFGFDIGKNSGGAWTPQQWEIRNGSSSSYGMTILLSNYPITCINYLNSADYGYWAQKYSGGKYHRQNYPLLPTEAQWEGAARNINNSYTCLSEFESDLSPSKNGLYPYALYSNDANSGLSGSSSDKRSDAIEQSIHYLDNICYKNGTILYSGSSSYYLPYAPVASLRASEAGLYDMNGNATERTSDISSGATTTSFQSGVLLTDPVNYSSAASQTTYSNRVAKSGYILNYSYALYGSIERSLYYDHDDLFCSFRISIAPL